MKQYSILIVDDSEIDRYLLKRIIKKSEISAEIFEAEDGQEAIDFFIDYNKGKETYGNTFPPVIIFLDINMPRIDGFGFLEKFAELRNSYTEYQSSVLMLFSSSDNKSDIDNAFHYDFVKDYIVKGAVEAAMLKEKITQTVNNFTS
jgi:CheY-like chemotaxis protein